MSAPKSSGPSTPSKLDAALWHGRREEPVAPAWWITPSGHCACPKKEKCDNPGKHPATRRGVLDATSDEEQIRKLWERQPHANLLLATGQASGWDVLDVDPRHGGDEALAALEREHGALPTTVEQITGSGGRHVLFRHQDGVTNSAGALPKGLDVRGTGGYIIVEPSNHISGGTYHWDLEHHPDETPIADWPSWLFDMIRSKPTTASADQPAAGGLLPAVIPEGQRDQTLTRYAGWLRRGGAAEAEILGALVVVNTERCKPPVSEEALKRIARSIGRKPAGSRVVVGFEAAKGDSDSSTADGESSDGDGGGKKKKRRGNGPKNGSDSDGEKGGRESQAVFLVRLIENEAELFHDQHSVPFAAVELAGHRELWPCTSTAFRRLIARRCFDTTGRVVGREAIAAALAVLEAKACFTGPRHELHTRVARDSEGIWYDNSDPDWSAIRILPGSWHRDSRPPILFVRHAHQAPQVAAVPGGDPWKLFDFLPQVAEESARLLLLVWTVTTLIGGFPVPLLILHGGHGAGKTSLFRTIRSLVDPSAMGTLTFPRDLTELVQQLSHHHACLFDNLGGLAGWQSDALCRAVTGEGFSKRVLFSDDDDFLYSFRRVIGLNGISVVAHKADLLDRSILVQLDRISPEQRRSEEELQATFEAARPSLLGAIFDILARALQHYPEVRLATLPRMADFTRWGCAVSRALGLSDDAFLSAYAANIHAQITEVVQSSPVAAAVSMLMEQRDEWRGSSADLLGELERVAVAARIDTRHGWPGSASILSRRLREVRSNLAEVGLLVDDQRGEKRVFHIYKPGKVPTVPSNGTLFPTALTAPDGKMPTLRGEVVF